MKEYKSYFKKFWYFIWEDDSVWSWIVNVILAFILIKFIVYPGLGFTLSTTHPVVAVVSESMEHLGNYDEWWDNGGSWYLENGISKKDFKSFKLRNGFDKGDIIILKGKSMKDIEVGDIIVFQTLKPDPLIHRVVKKWKENSVYLVQTKGDNYATNKKSIKGYDNQGYYIDETRISEEQIIGEALFRIPLLGYIKILFVALIDLTIQITTA